MQRYCQSIVYLLLLLFTLLPFESYLLDSSAVSSRQQQLPDASRLTKSLQYTLFLLAIAPVLSAIVQLVEHSIVST
jgi:hypothetical protein